MSDDTARPTDTTPIPAGKAQLALLVAFANLARSSAGARIFGRRDRESTRSDGESDAVMIRPETPSSWGASVAFGAR